MPLTLALALALALVLALTVTGGLRVFLKDAPTDWNFHEFNRDSSKIYSFLDSNGGDGETEVRVSYRRNRAVIFHSKLFHTTDLFKFRCCKYKDRRINVTMLFGIPKAKKEK